MSWGRRFDDFETCRLKALKVVRQVSAELPPLSSSKLAGSKGRRRAAHVARTRDLSSVDSRSLNAWGLVEGNSRAMSGTCMDGTHRLPPPLTTTVYLSRTPTSAPAGRSRYRFEQRIEGGPTWVSHLDVEQGAGRRCGKSGAPAHAPC
ncbi:MAG: hypothetical protein KDH15_08755, partial [Rhodocyclaceae bacterium]|nr:hypothetical protein [Rhodocyclaceae bacterium]